jgi:hypothetical protein
MPTGERAHFPYGRRQNMQCIGRADLPRAFRVLQGAFACFPSTPDSQRLQGRDVRMFITHLRKEPHAMFERRGIVELLGEDAFYEDVRKAMRLTGEMQG